MTYEPDTKTAKTTFNEHEIAAAGGRLFTVRQSNAESESNDTSQFNASSPQTRMFFRRFAWLFPRLKNLLFGGQGGRNPALMPYVQESINLMAEVACFFLPCWLFLLLSKIARRLIYSLYYIQY